MQLNELDRAVLRGKALMDFYNNAFVMLGERTIEDAIVDLIAYREAGNDETGEDDGFDED
jgi:hypothetical protein